MCKVSCRRLNCNLRISIAKKEGDGMNTKTEETRHHAEFSDTFLHLFVLFFYRFAFSFFATAAARDLLHTKCAQKMIDHRPLLRMQKLLWKTVSEHSSKQREGREGR